MKEEPLHREIVEEHASNPQYYQKLVSFSHTCSHCSQQTGNICTIQLLEQDGFIAGIGCQLQASALATACASLMACHVRGLSVSKTKVLIQQVLQYVEGEEGHSLPGDLFVYESIRLFSERHDCALLGWRTLKKALGS